MGREGKLIEKAALTFDDVLLVPAKSDILPAQVKTESRLTKRIGIKIPLVSAAMDTVTESGLAIALAREGGIGIIHRNLSEERQSEEVRKVKKSESWIIKSPQTIGPNDSLAMVRKVQDKLGISTFPVVRQGKLVGILSNRDMRFEDDVGRKVSEMMTKDVITMAEEVSMEKAIEIMSSHKIEKLPVVDKHGALKGLITMTDIEKNRKYPAASKDREGRLLVGAAIGPFDDKRVELLVKNDVDVILLDSAHGHSRNILECVKRVKRQHDIDVIAGNVATAEGTEDLINAGADAVKVGIGAGSICTSRIIAGVGVPQITAVLECSESANRHGVPLISDGGTRYSGDIAKAIAAGADSVMLGSLLAGTEESPGRAVFIQGRKYKSYRGMGSLNAMKMGSADRYFTVDDPKKKLVPEGIEGIVPFRGTVKEMVYQLVGGLKSSMGYVGCKTMDEMREKTVLRRISKAGSVESHPHDVLITEEAPNYWKVTHP
jgi:IMP dehydrogenase